MSKVVKSRFHEVTPFTQKPDLTLSIRPFFSSLETARIVLPMAESTSWDNRRLALLDSTHTTLAKPPNHLG
jgi:hypothetical protein